MKVTPYNKDEIARKIAECAWKQPDDAVANNMLRVSEALTTVGTSFSQFRTLESFKAQYIPSGETELTNVTYEQALIDAMRIAGI